MRVQLIGISVCLIQCVFLRHTLKDNRPQAQTLTVPNRCVSDTIQKYEKVCNFQNKVLQYRKPFSWFDFQNKGPGNRIKVDQDSLKFNLFRKEKVSFQKCTIFKNNPVI